MEGDKKPAIAHWKFYRILCIMALTSLFMPLPNQKHIFHKASKPINCFHRAVSKPARR